MLKLKLFISIILLGFISFTSILVSYSPSYAATQSTSIVLNSSDTPNILVPPAQGPGVAQRLTTRARSSWPWYITRAAGLVAAVALVALILSGVGMITGVTFKFLEPLTAWATHRALGLLFAVSVLIHVVALLFDRYVPFTIAQVLVPFASHYRDFTFQGHKLGSLWVALGIFAGYATIAIIISSLLWIDKKPYTWKAFHFLTYLVMIFVFFHALYLGTDLTHGFFRALWYIFGVSVAIAIIYRLRRARSI